MKREIPLNTVLYAPLVDEKKYFYYDDTRKEDKHGTEKIGNFISEERKRIEPN